MKYFPYSFFVFTTNRKLIFYTCDIPIPQFKKLFFETLGSIPFGVYTRRLMTLRRHPNFLRCWHTDARAKS